MTSRRTLLLVFIATVLVVLLAGCSTQRERSFKIHPDWSKGQVNGTANAAQPVGLAADEQGAYLLWTAQQETGTRLQYARLELDGTTALTRTLPVATFLPRRPQLVSQDDLAAFVIARLSSTESDGVHYLALSRDGDLLDEPQRLSSPEQRSAYLSAAPGADGSAELLWDVIEGPGRGIYHLRILPNGEPDGFPQLIGIDGTQPTGQVDAAGNLHAAWLTEVSTGRFDLNYAVVPAGAQFGTTPVQLTSLVIPISDIVQPLSLGLDQSHIYILWSQEHRGGLQVGASEVFLVSFPIDQPDRVTQMTVPVPETAEPPYQEMTAYPPLTLLAPFDEENVDWTTYIEAPAIFSSAQPRESVKALADMKYSLRFGNNNQLALLVFEDGRFAGYQRPARTDQNSLRPHGVVDAGGQLHMTWVDLEQPGAYSVYYASTKPEVKAVLDQRTVNDTMLDIAEVAWGTVSGIGLVPFVFCLFAPVFVFLGVFYVTGNDDSLKTSWSARLTLIVTLVVYFGGKTFAMGGLVYRPPFMNLIPASLQPLWILLFLLLVAALAALALLVYIRRSERPYLFRGVLTFILTDILLTLVLYGPRFFSE